MELSRLGIVYIHLIACCVAIGLVLTSDIAMVKQLLQGDSAGPSDYEHMDSLQKTVSRALAVLWVTGVAIIAMDVSAKGWGYFANPKIQAKIGLVVLLTINGVLLHKTVLPLLHKVGSLLNLTVSQRLLALFAGTFVGCDLVLCRLHRCGPSAGMEVLAGGIAGSLPGADCRRSLRDAGPHGLGQIQVR
jgi:hypothetical protein